MCPQRGSQQREGMRKGKKHTARVRIGSVHHQRGRFVSGRSWNFLNVH